MLHKLVMIGTLAVIGLVGGLLLRQPAMVSIHEAQASAGEDDPGSGALEPTIPPEFPRAVEWLQSEPIKLADLRGRVVVVHFWTFGCSNCIHNYPVYKTWQENYKAQDVTIIGVHTPEFAHEADATRVGAKARENGLKFPIAIDNDQAIWNRWNNHFWPSIYLLDRKGQLRYRWEGELHLSDSAGRKFASRIDELLAERP